MATIAAIVISYLLGAIPTAYIIARSQGINIFEVGSGNMGATNVARALGMFWGIAVWVIDSSKGILAVLVARALLPDDSVTAGLLGAIVAIIGHNWSVFVLLLTGRLTGGKGASIVYGTLLIIAPHVLLIMTVIGFVVLVVTRYVSLTVLVMVLAAALSIITLATQELMPPQYVVYIGCVVALIVYRFRENIQRLAQGKERRLGERV